MTSSPPDLIAIEHDDYHASHVGRCADGSQFFLTTPFIPAVDGPGREFIALYLFDPDGNLIKADIEDMGERGDDALPPGNPTEEFSETIFSEKLKKLGEVEFTRIEVKPFSLKRFGTVFGLIVRKPESDDDEYWVTLEPGNYMAFHEPWDSGEYDT